MFIKPSLALHVRLCSIWFVAALIVRVQAQATVCVKSLPLLYDTLFIFGLI